MKHLSLNIVSLTTRRDPARGQCLVGSLTGAVSCQMVTQEHKGSLIADGNGDVSVKVYGSLTARHTGRAGTKVGLNDLPNP